jgi:sec-independent protein translocase protein TatB
MFEVGFSELCMVGLVALLVIGPEKLPKLARLAGFWLGKTRSMVASVKAEIKEELHAEEMRQLFNAQQEDISNFKSILDDASQEVNAIQSSVQESLQDAESQVLRPHETK